MIIVIICCKHQKIKVAKSRWIPNETKCRDFLCKVHSSNDLDFIEEECDECLREKLEILLEQRKNKS